MKIYLATGNPGKVHEFQALLKANHVELELAPLPEGVEILETGETFEENAKLKAEGYAFYYPGSWVVAEDSGLACDLLEGRPGVYSARYAGRDTPYPEKFAKLYAELKEVDPDPTAWTCRYVSVVAVRSPKGDVKLYRGELCGRITQEPRGEGGFGYDPVFYLPDRGVTCAELTLDEKNEISHRARAVAAWEEDGLKA